MCSRVCLGEPLRSKREEEYEGDGGEAAVASGGPVEEALHSTGER
jgi:hypothetical protein